MSDRVTCTITDGVADVRLNRPEKMNALDPGMFAALAETGEALKADQSVRAVVLSGEGRAFCAGLDFGSFQAMAGDDQQPKVEFGARPGGRITNPGQQAAFVWYEMPAPVIAAVHGPCLGGGFQIALACDLRIVARDVKMSVLEVRWGLVPDMTGTQLLPRVVGLDVAKELTFTGRMIDGEEAVRLGVATRVSENFRDDALALAAEIATKSPQAVRGAKSLLNLAGTVGLEEGFKAEETTIKGLIGSPNQVEAVTAYFEKRSPRFRDG
jgi:enoyl-CoA hydratase/carnithine racemase